jgi:hypothetical protein
MKEQHQGLDMECSWLASDCYSETLSKCKLQNPVQGNQILKKLVTISE